MGRGLCFYRSPLPGVKPKDAASLVGSKRGLPGERAVAFARFEAEPRDPRVLPLPLEVLNALAHAHREHRNADEREDAADRERGAEANPLTPLRKVRQMGEVARLRTPSPVNTAPATMSPVLLEGGFIEAGGGGSTS